MSRQLFDSKRCVCVCVLANYFCENVIIFQNPHVILPNRLWMGSEGKFVSFRMSSLHVSVALFRTNCYQQTAWSESIVGTLLESIVFIILGIFLIFIVAGGSV